MSPTYLARKISGCCPRCGAPSSETSILCEPHRRDLALRVKRWYDKNVAASRQMLGSG